jgi:hypothetical protein
MPTSGFLIRHAAGITFRDCEVTWGPDAPGYFEHALDAEACTGLDYSGLKGQAAHPGMTAYSVH